MTRTQAQTDGIEFFHILAGVLDIFLRLCPRTQLSKEIFRAAWSKEFSLIQSKYLRRHKNSWKPYCPGIYSFQMNQGLIHFYNG